MPLSFVLVDDLKFVIWGRSVGNARFYCLHEFFG